MSLTLHLGVIDEPYAGEAGTTTHNVAVFLEAKYAVMGTFAQLHAQDIGELFAIGMAETIEALAMGAPPTLSPTGQAASETEQLFRTYLTNEEITEAGVAGVPTAAAQEGRSSRFKKRKGSRRPSFVDTGLYRKSFKAWVD